MKLTSTFRTKPINPSNPSNPYTFTPPHKKNPSSFRTAINELGLLLLVILLTTVLAYSIHFLQITTLL